MAQTAVDNEDLSRYLHSLRQLRRTATDEEWLEIGWDFLKTMGLNEFYGCDIDLLPIIENIPPGSDFIDVQCYLQLTLVEALLETLEDGGTTTLLDTKQMEDTPAAALIPRINELRKEELRSVQVPIEGREIVIYDLHLREIGSEIQPVRRNPVMLGPLWLTAHGSKVLRKLGMGARTDLDGLRKIERALEKLGGNMIRVPKTNDACLREAQMSPAMKALLLKRAEAAR